MMNFILSRDNANIVSDAPRVKKFLLDPGLLSAFPQIIEFGRLKMKNIIPGSLNFHFNRGIEICYVREGNYQWTVEGKTYALYPGDSFFTCPWQKHGSPKGVLDIGCLDWIIIAPEQFTKKKNLTCGKWSSLMRAEMLTLDKIFRDAYHTHIFKSQQAALLFDEMIQEILYRPVGFESRINRLTDELLISTARSLQEYHQKKIPGKSGANDIEKLKINLQNHIHYHWSVKEMSEIMNMRLSRFNAFVKGKTGYSPFQYLISLRVEAAKHYLKTSSLNITQIALECGFYSSQHFAKVFKDWTGMKPRDFNPT